MKRRSKAGASRSSFMRSRRWPSCRSNLRRLWSAPLRRSFRGSGAGEMPKVIHPVPGCVTGFLVLGPRIERFAFVGPLLAAVVAADERKTSRRLRIGVGNQGQPINRALGVAIRFVLAVAIKHVERHTVEVDEGLAPGGVAAD